MCKLGMHAECRCKHTNRSREPFAISTTSHVQHTVQQIGRRLLINRLSDESFARRLQQGPASGFDWSHGERPPSTPHCPPPPATPPPHPTRSCPREAWRSIRERTNDRVVVRGRQPAVLGVDPADRPPVGDP